MQEAAIQERDLHVIWLRGAPKSDINLWQQFVDLFEPFCSSLPQGITNFGAGGDEFKGGKYLIYNTRGRNRLKKSLAAKDSFRHLSFLAVADDCVTMMFDADYICMINAKDCDQLEIVCQFRTSIFDTEELIQKCEELSKLFFESARVEEFATDETPTSRVWNFNPKEPSELSRSAIERKYLLISCHHYNRQGEQDGATNPLPAE